MKNIFLILFLALIYSNASALENEPDDFKGLKFGQNLKFNKNMSLVEETLDFYVYKKNNDELEFEGVKLISIQYLTTKGICYGLVVTKDGKYRLWGVSMAFKGLDNYTTIRDSLNEKHGKGSDLTKKDLDKVKSMKILSDRTPSRPKKGCVWEGDKVEIRLFYGFPEKVSTDDLGTIGIINKKWQKTAYPVVEGVGNMRNVKPIEIDPASTVEYVEGKGWIRKEEKKNPLFKWQYKRPSYLKD